MLNAKYLMVFGLLAARTLANDVFTYFYDPSGKILGSSYDVGNNNCFAVGNAVQITFSQAGTASGANGPYCLNAYADNGCPGNANGQQSFSDVSFGPAYNLNGGVGNAGSYRWSLGNCNGT